MATRLTTCTKTGYPSPQAAWHALEQIDRRSRRRRRGKRSRYGYERVYQCSSAGCRMWHITAGEWGTARELEA
jgi:hypothetical protein